jgi:type II secretory pathway predicted ATPase ExeA/UDP-N-acetylglucosamine 2-epimerase
MYERHFGITGPPFQLSPDPSFYFDGSQHRAALSMLRQAFSRSLPFAVLSGEIGAGKTTVLHTWLAECRAAGTAVAQITNTQLDAAELQCAIAAAFGLDVPHAQPQEAASALRRFFHDLKGNPAVLAIDEAQNLDRPGLLSLVQLAQVAAEERAELRIVLAGQPELRGHVSEGALPELDAMVQQACHLGPLDAGQTRDYIEHRLQKVGWTGVPEFDAFAFEEIHELTGGIPRRINVLANRLLLGQFLNHTARIDRRAVTAIAQALDAEIGDGTVTLESPRETGTETPDRVAWGSLLVLASGRSDYIKAIALMHAADQQPGLAPTVAVGLSDSTPWQLNLDHRLHLGWAQRLVALANDTATSSQEVEVAFEGLIRQCQPKAVLVFDGDAMSHRCAVVAVRHGVPVVHVGADAQTLDERNDPQSSRAAISQLASLRFDCQHADAAGRFVQRQPSFAVGSLLVDALYLAWEVAKKNAGLAGRPLASGKQVDERRGYGVVALRQLPLQGGQPLKPGVLALLREVSRDLPLVWPMRHDTMLMAHRSGLARTVEGDRIARIEELGYVNHVRLMRGATCVLTDSADVMEEAAALAVPCLSLGVRHVSHAGAGGWLPAIEVDGNAKAATRAVWQILFRGADDVDLPDDWDGQAGKRIAKHLASWLESAAVEKPQPPTLRHALRTPAGAGNQRDT